jgi:hypothetical protein
MMLDKMLDKISPGELRDRMLRSWAKFDKGELSATEARVHIGFARVVIETMKVEIAMAHFGPAIAPSGLRVLPGGKRKAG